MTTESVLWTLGLAFGIPNGLVIAYAIRATLLVEVANAWRKWRRR